MRVKSRHCRLQRQGRSPHAHRRLDSGLSPDLPGGNPWPSSKVLISGTEPSKLTWLECRGQDRIARATASLEWPFAFNAMLISLRTSIYSPTGTLATNSVTITPHNTIHFQIFRGRACGRKVREYTNPLSTSRKRHGRGSGSWYRLRTPSCM